MWTIIARKELLEISRDGRLRALALSLLLLSGVSLALGLSNARTQARAVAEASAMDRSQWLTQDPKSPHAAAHFGVWAYRPRPLTAAIDEGLDAFLGVGLWLEAHKQNDLRFRPARDETAVVRFGRASVALSLGLLLPLLITALCAPIFSREREAGTLRLLWSLGVSPTQVALGKAAGTCAALLLLVGPLLLLAALGLVLYDGLALLPRFALLAGAWTLYLLGFLLLSLTVSALARRPSAALAALFLLWAAQVMVLPRALADLSRTVYAPPTSAAFQARIKEELERGPSGHDSADARLQQLKERLLRQYGVKRVEDLPLNFDGAALQLGEEVGNEVFDRNYGALHALFQQQRKLEERLGVLVPLVPVRSLSMALCGTDLSHHIHFVNAAEKHRRLLVKIMNDAMTYGWKSGDWESTAGPEVWAKVPAFHYQAPTLAHALRGQGANAASLLAFVMLSALTLLLAVRRWRPL